ncbi:MAG TPA: hypothetical protein VEC06_04915 [Paucimonas sp.]|nr:hypothetical protein [Paucimonas sp.]
MKIRSIALSVVLLAAIAGCAQVPKESVELSSTVGRDVTALHQSHRNLAKLLFSRMRADINRFIDNTYAPYQIRSAMERDFQNSKSALPEDRQASLLLAINNAFQPGASDKLQESVLRSMGVMVRLIQEDIESQRRELLAQIDQQEEEVMGSIDRNYAQIIYANSIVTGYLGSVVRVHDAQNEALQAIGAKADLSQLIGVRLASASDKVKSLVEKAQQADSKVQKVEDTLQEIKNAVSKKP